VYCVLVAVSLCMKPPLAGRRDICTVVCFVLVRERAVVVKNRVLISMCVYY
jgi:hypothetical protein